MNAFVIFPSATMKTERAFESNLKSVESSSSDESHIMKDTSRLSHAMLKVPSVDRTAAYWTEKMGSIIMSRSREDGTLQSAFVALGNGETTDKCFALELVETSSESFKLGNSLSYIGVSMLLQFQDNLLGALTGEKPEGQGDEPNGILVRSSASAPGDYFCRFCLKSRNLVETNDFYTSVLGMDAKAVDADMLCLRYDATAGMKGVPTTIVFERSDDELDRGKCFDHLVITTSLDINEQYKRIKETHESAIYMIPTEMFGKTVMGIRDPNQYKIILASE
eukprot:CAMPEP_0194264524 /NCGR_PEP_ID=MMETSP0158-20130606/47628_1 /TAXON_ID=33649 /ORGANISM="Thalassionema nitzschioides, Strain L26-B" /LENGTH=278 /DNA_ID=CAMNT_0039004765 /DNA_START=62 /DNA_END=898 /DNA_ORIENTATION=-